MAVAHKGAISFGLVHIPISLYTATQSNDISFNQLHDKCKERIHYKKYCDNCDEEVKNENIVKGYQFEKDRYIEMDEEDFEKIKTEKDKTIQIIQFTDINEIDPIYYEKAYYATPDAGGDKAFELLRSAMKDENKVAIAKTVIGTKDSLLTIYPISEGIIIEKMFYFDEIKDIPKTYSKGKLNDKEMEMAKMLINSMTQSFDPASYKDEYQQRLKDAIAQKINGKEITAPKEKTDNIIDLMDALKASIDQKNLSKSKSKPSKPSKKPREMARK